MSLARFVTITMEPDQTDARVKFHPTREAAYDHAKLVSKDLNRDAYVAEWSHVFRADRETWRKDALEKI